MPLRLTDEQIAYVMDAASRFARRARSRLLSEFAARLPTAPNDSDVRVAVAAAIAAFLEAKAL
jgi:hypothetical protein